MSIEFVTSLGAGQANKVTRTGTFNKVIALTSNVEVTITGSGVTGGETLTLPRNLKIEEYFDEITVSDGTVAIFTP